MVRQAAHVTSQGMSETWRHLNNATQTEHSLILWRDLCLVLTNALYHKAGSVVFTCFNVVRLLEIRQVSRNHRNNKAKVYDAVLLCCCYTMRRVHSNTCVWAQDDCLCVWQSPLSCNYSLIKLGPNHTQTHTHWQTNTNKNINVHTPTRMYSLPPSTNTHSLTLQAAQQHLLLCVLACSCTAVTAHYSSEKKTLFGLSHAEFITNNSQRWLFVLMFELIANDWSREQQPCKHWWKLIPTVIEELERTVGFIVPASLSSQQTIWLKKSTLTAIIQITQPSFNLLFTNVLFLLPNVKYVL